jgi:MFS transporter, DHA2 family, multidrug resistance protein
VLGFTATQSGLALMPRTLIMMVVTPFVGKFYNKISPRLVVGVGVILFVISAIQMSHYTLETSSAGIVSALLIQGAAFACLFVPLTTIAISKIPRHKLADATGSNSLVRQIGASIGVAVFATLQTRAMTHARFALVAHLNPGNPEVMSRLASIQQMFRARGGLDATSARGGATAMLNFVVNQQATVLSFEKMFLLAGIIFLLILPLLLFLKTDSSKPAEKVDVHLDM